MLMTEKKKTKVVPKVSPKDDDTGVADDWVSRTFRVPPGTYRQLQESADRCRRSINLQLVWLLEKSLEAHLDESCND